MILDGLTKVQVATLYSSSATQTTVGQATFNFNPDSTGSGASTLAVIGVSAALIAVAAF